MLLPESMKNNDSNRALRDPLRADGAGRPGDGVPAWLILTDRDLLKELDIALIYSQWHRDDNEQRLRSPNYRTSAELTAKVQ